MQDRTSRRGTDSSRCSLQGGPFYRKSTWTGHPTNKCEWPSDKEKREREGGLVRYIEVCYISIRWQSVSPVASRHFPSLRVSHKTPLSRSTVMSAECGQVLGRLCFRSWLPHTNNTAFGHWPQHITLRGRGPLPQPTEIQNNRELESSSSLCDVTGSQGLPPIAFST